MTLSLACAAFQTAAAQWGATGYGVAQGDTKSTWFFLAGVSASPKAQGLQPMVGLQAYYLTYDVGVASRNNVTAFQPAVGLTDNYNGGQVYGTVGYEFTNNTTSGVPFVAGATGRGAVLNLGWDHWGTGGPMAYQALGSYNFGSQSIWTRGRITTRVSQSGQSQLRVGGELAYQSGNGYTAWEPGGVLEWHFPRGEILGLGVGETLAGVNGNATYFRVEGVLPLVR